MVDYVVEPSTVFNVSVARPASVIREMDRGKVIVEVSGEGLLRIGPLGPSPDRAGTGGRP